MSDAIKNLSISNAIAAVFVLSQIYISALALGSVGKQFCAASKKSYKILFVSLLKHFLFSASNGKLLDRPHSVFFTTQKLSRDA